MSLGALIESVTCVVAVNDPSMHAAVGNWFRFTAITVVVGLGFWARLV
jgi:hypothetical protein